MIRLTASTRRRDRAGGSATTAAPAISRWWGRIPEDLYASASKSPIDDEFPRRVKVSAAIDVICRSALGGALGAGLKIALADERRLGQDMERLNYYCELVDQARLDQLFQPPGSRGPVHIQSLRPTKISGQSVCRHDLCFKSDFEPLNPALDELFNRHQRNTLSTARYWRHPGEPRPVLVFSHGYFLSSHHLNAAMFQLKWFFSHGFNIVQFTLPFHGIRREKGAPFSGASLIGHGFSLMNEAMYQAVHDLRTLIRFLKDDGAPSVGLSGLSLGGYVSSATACVEQDVAFCIPNASPVSMIDAASGWWLAGRAIRDLLKRKGIGISFLRHAFAGHNALTWPSQIGNDRHALVAGAGDRFVPPQFPILLSEHWGQAPIHWFPGNHLVHLGQSNYNREILAFMKQKSRTLEGSSDDK